MLDEIKAMLDVGCWMLNVGWSKSDVGCWMFDFG